MISNILIFVDDLKYLSDYRKAGVSAFLFALEDFSVGYKTYSIEEINNVDVSNKYVIINRILTSDDIDKLKKIIKKFKTIKGLVFEDVGVYEFLRKLDTNLELILFQNHFCTNSNSVNFWLDKVDSVFISNELTYDEISLITKQAKKSVCLHLFGYNQVMYSRRLLLSNWSEYFALPSKKQNTIIDQATKVQFKAYEDKYGTIMYSGNIFNGHELLTLKNVKYFYINTMLIPHQRILQFLKDLNSIDNQNEDDGFLHKSTIYKLKERAK